MKMRKDKNNQYEMELHNEETGEEIQIYIRSRNLKEEKEAELIGVFEATEEQMKEILCPSESSPEHQRTKRIKKLTEMEWLKLKEEEIVRGIRFAEESISHSTEALGVVREIESDLEKKFFTDDFTPTEKAAYMEYINSQREFYKSILGGDEERLSMLRKELEVVQGIIRYLEKRTVTLGSGGSIALNGIQGDI